MDNKPFKYPEGAWLMGEGMEIVFLLNLIPVFFALPY